MSDSTKDTMTTILDIQCKQIEEMSLNIKELTANLNKLIIDFEVFKKEMQIKSGIFGLIGGCIPVAIGFLMWLLEEKLIR